MTGNLWEGGSDLEIKRLHCWNLQYHEAVKVQEELKGKLRFTKLPQDVRLIAGADVAYAKNKNILYAAVIVLALPDLVLVEQRAAQGKATFPYIPGLLSFREAPVLLKAFRNIKSTPHVIIFDGQGTAHPRRFGLASHLGLVLDIPAIGCAKSLLVGKSEPVGETAGSYTYLMDRGEVIGVALRTKSGIRPVIVSPGHKITLKESIKITLKCVQGYRLPEPTRQAHLLVNKIRMAS